MPAYIFDWHFHWKFWAPKKCVGGPVYIGWWATTECEGNRVAQSAEQISIKRSMGWLPAAVMACVLSLGSVAGAADIWSINRAYQNSLNSAFYYQSRPYYAPRYYAAPSYGYVGQLQTQHELRMLRWAVEDANWQRGWRR